MEDSIKCPECGGTKYTRISAGNYRCLYCGATFKADADGAPQEVPDGQPKYTKVRDKNKITAIVLAFLLGSIGAQYFYLGKIGSGILCLLFCWTYIPAVIGIADGIRFLIMDDKTFDMKYNCLVEY